MTSPTPALFDELGPRGQKRLRIATIVAVVALIGIVAGAIAQLAHVQQLTARLWEPLIEWSNIRYLLQGLLTTLEVGLTGAAISLVFGTLIGLGRLSTHKWISVPSAGVIELFRAIPLILLVYFFLIGLPMFGWNLPPFWVLTIPIVLHAGSVFAEIVRAGVNSLDRGQFDAAAAIGLRRGQTMKLIVLPQVFRSLRPALVTQVIRTLKESSLGYVVGYPELLRDGQVIGEYNANFLQTYAFTAVIYIVINFGLSRLAELLDRPKKVRRPGPAATEPEPEPAAEPARTLV
ncbi:amino acid ABC transporter permease [Amycolatopsis sp. FDAARGOS 1241]|uniref:amino acid ABC transporter permease n=1 Tax=Amycolatopsis sp. FDAARGOS 1241 TaxID=2778070 RepID=UPI0019503600|nr:amino acid ABC transporter permease [Amycolatopsis sp. FDAARGOS 1241]QRP47708.1 amino acid ABC transporter permease [Amycolatopsis sp. FDAARGOS 1241]